MASIASTKNRLRRSYPACYNIRVHAQLLNIVSTMALCFLAWGLFYNLLHRKGVTYTRHFLWTTTYFLVVAMVMCAVFWRHLVPAIQGIALVPLMALVVFIAVQLVFFVYVPRRLREPCEYFEAHPDRYYLKIDWRRLVSKSADIAAQQVFIFLLIVFLREAGFSLYQIVASFTFLFALLHVPLIASEKGRWPSWLFAGAVLVFGVTFPPLILYTPYGFIYSYIIHWSFYMLTALIFWIRYDKRRIFA